jgi:DnaJ-class molecular chaperone
MVDIPKGAMDGERITFDGVTDEKIGHHTGNLVLVITTNPHKLFKRVGDNLNMEWTISLHDALVGFTRTFEHIDGRVVTVTRDVVTHPGEYHTVPGEGMPRKGGGKGNLIIHYTIEFPQFLTVASRRWLRICRLRCCSLTSFAAISKRPSPQDFGIIVPRAC